MESRARGPTRQHRSTPGRWSFRAGEGPAGVGGRVEGEVRPGRQHAGLAQGGPEGCPEQLHSLIGMPAVHLLGQALGTRRGCPHLLQVLLHQSGTFGGAGTLWGCR